MKMNSMCVRIGQNNNLKNIRLNIGKSRNYISLIRIHSYFKASLLHTLLITSPTSKNPSDFLFLAKHTPGAFELPSK